MGRAPCCDKANVKKGPWSPEEDAKLKEFIQKFGTVGNWIALPQKAGLKRCGKSCRLRWLNYLRPNIRHGEFSDEEDRIICTLYATIGSRWSIIAAQLPGRTDNDIKNYWNTKLKKKLFGIIPSNQLGSRFSFSPPIFQTSSTQVLSQPIITGQQNFMHSNTTTNNLPLSLTSQDCYNQQDEEVFVDNWQYNYPVIKENNHVKEEEIIMECFQGFVSNGFEETHQKLMLHCGKNVVNEDNYNYHEDLLSTFLDQKTNGLLEKSQLQTYEFEEVKELIATGNGCNNNNNSNNLLSNNDENKI